MRPAAARVDALLFDLGGVVIEIDFNRAFQAWANAARNPAAAIAARFSFDAAYEAHECGRLDAPRYFNHMRASLGVELPDEQLLAGWNEIFVDAVPGIDALLRQLAASFPLYAFSNTNSAHRMFWRPRYAGLLATFSAVFCSCDLGERKPSARSFLSVCERIGLQPSRVAFFDDHAENVRGARAAGLLAYEVHCTADVRRALRDELDIRY